MESASKRRKIGSGYQSFGAAPSGALNGSQTPQERQYTGISPKQPGWATASTFPSAPQIVRTSAASRENSAVTNPNNSAFRQQINPNSPTVSSAKTASGAQARLPTGRENVPPSNFSSSSSSIGSGVLHDTNEMDVFSIEYQNQAPAALTGQRAQHHLSGYSAMEVRTGISADSLETGHAWEQAAPNGLDQIEHQLVHPHPDPLAAVPVSDSADDPTPEEEEILLPEDYDAIAFLEDEDPEGLDSASDAAPSPHPPPSRERSTIRSRIRKGKKAAERALAALHAKGEWFGLPKVVEEIYRCRGITQLYPWQTEVLSNPDLLADTNFVVCQPTSAGKTLIAEICLLRKAFNDKKKAIFLMPFVSIVQEKIRGMKEFSKKMFVPVEGYYGNQGTLPPAEGHGIFIGTFEKGASLLNHLIEANRLSEVGIVVVDEAHNVSLPDRGFTLEMLISKIQFKCPEIQILCLSATIPNIDIMASWLHAKKFEPKARPVELREHIVYKSVMSRVDRGPDGRIQHQELYSLEPYPENPEDVAVRLCIESALHEDGPLSVLVFCSSKKMCEDMARRISEEFKRHERDIESQYKRRKWRGRTDSYVEGLKNRGKNKLLQECMKNRVAFHSSALVVDEKSIVEQAFLQRVCLVICCTTTLAAGVNLPARRVIICTPKVGIDPLSRRDYAQMIGRAGRSGFTEFGESFLLYGTSDKRGSIDSFLGSQLEPISSCLLSNPRAVSHVDKKLLTRMVMDLVGSGICVNRDQIMMFVASTLFHTVATSVESPAELAARAETIQRAILSTIDTLINGDGKGNDRTKMMAAAHVEYAIQVLDEELHRVSARERPLVASYQALKRAEYASAQQQSLLDGTAGTVLYLTKLGDAAFRGRLDVNTANAMESRLIHLNCGIRFDFPVVSFYALLSSSEPVSFLKPHLWLRLCDIWTSNANEPLALMMKAYFPELSGEDLVGLCSLKDDSSRKDKINSSPNALPWKRLIAALVMQDEVTGREGESTIARILEMSAGDVEAIRDKAAPSAQNVIAFASRLGFTHLSKAWETYIPSLSTGIGEEIAPLCDIRGVGSWRAKQLYEKGYVTVKQIADANPADLHKTCNFNPGGLSAAKRIVSAAKKLLEIRYLEMNKQIKELNPTFLAEEEEEEEGFE